MSVEFATLALLSYSLALVGVFAFPTVRQRVPRLAVVLLVVVPWAAALFAGALTHTPTESAIDVPELEYHRPPLPEDPIRIDANNNQCLDPANLEALGKYKDAFEALIPLCRSERRQLQSWEYQDWTFSAKPLTSTDCLDSRITPMNAGEYCTCNVAPPLPRSERRCYHIINNRNVDLPLFRSCVRNAEFVPKKDKNNNVIGWHCKGRLQEC